MEIKLTNVARASLEELLRDYLDSSACATCPSGTRIPRKPASCATWAGKTPQTYERYRTFVETRPPQVIANIVICLIHQANYLLDQQLKTLEQEFLKQGGLRERMTRARLNHRHQHSPK
jgi:four helix bundle suffix protein